jgi:hypothetical protein
MVLPGQGNGKAVRVCLQCFDAASKVKASTRPLADDIKEQRNSADSSGGDSSGDDDEIANKEENHDEVCRIFHKSFENFFKIFLCLLQYRYLLFSQNFIQV